MIVSHADKGMKAGPLSTFPLDAKRWAALVHQFHLSPRQRQVAECILHAMQDKEIADTLNIEVPTVRRHIDCLFRRLDVANRVAFVVKLWTAAEGMGAGGETGCF